MSASRRVKTKNCRACQPMSSTWMKQGHNGHSIAVVGTDIVRGRCARGMGSLDTKWWVRTTKDIFSCSRSDHTYCIYFMVTMQDSSLLRFATPVSNHTEDAEVETDDGR